MARFFASRGDLTSHYALFNGQDGDGIYAIGAATRTNETWTENAGNPVLSSGSSGAWDDSSVKDPCLIWDGSQYVMYFSGYDGATFRIGRATAASHTGPWTKYASNPVLDLGAGGSVDASALAFPTVLYEPTDTGKEWKCWYAGTNGSGVSTVCYAHSSNGLSWTKVGRVVNVGAGGTWNDEGVLPGAITKVAGTYYLYVGGRQDPTVPKWQGGLWTFTDPEGTYTANGGNPLILARFNDAGVSQTPTATVNAGDTTVALSDTSKYNVGEPIVIADNDSTAHVGYVTTLNSGVLLTLDRAVVGTFNSTHGFVFRPFAMVSNIPRTVLSRASGGYEAFVSLFEPVEDLAQTGSKLWEGSFEMRASALTGTWSYHYVSGRGLLFPLVSGASWHTRSAENPSVIAAP